MRRTPYFFLNFSARPSVSIKQGKKSALVPSLVYKLNSAEGVNKAYHRFDVGLTYLDSRRWGATWYTNVNYYILEFPDHDEKRSDSNLSVSLGVNRSFAKTWGWGVNLSQINNSSNVNANDYKKFVATTQLNYTWQ